MIHENIDVSGSLKVSGSFSLPKHASSADVTALSGSMYHDTTDNVAKIYTGTEWVVVGEQTTGSSAAADIEYLLVAGGGGGGGRHAGGAGAGGYLSSSLAAVTSGSSFTVTVGSGGAGAPDGSTTGNKQGASGTNSTIAGESISTITAIAGGGGGGDPESPYDGSGGDGGSGGGATYVGSAGSGTNGQGNNGGNGQGSPNYSGGGGGGASTAGANSSGTQAGAGGSGLTSTITGTSITRAGGGGAGGWNGVSAGAGGTGGGGAGIGNASNTNATSGTTNTGGGGGAGGGETSAGGDGGSGVAILAYPTGSINAAGGIVGDAGNGRKYHQFNSSDTFKVGSTSDFQIVTDNLGLHIDAGNFDSRGTSTATDLSTNSNDMSVTGATLNNNYYYSFSSTSTYLTRASAASIKSTTALTLEAWIRLTDLTNQWKPIFSKGNTDSAEDYLLMARPGSNSIYFDCGGGSLYAQPSFTWASNTWYHIVATHSKPSGTSTMAITINNSALSVTTNGATGAAGNTSDALYIGTARNNSIGGTGIQIAQARIYTKILSAAEITQNYNATKTNFV